MATISGVWKWNDGNLGSPYSGESININFKSYPDNFEYSGIGRQRYNGYYLFYNNPDGSRVTITDNMVVKEEYKYMDFGQVEQTISDSDYQWIYARATRQRDSIPTLISIENLQYFKTKLDNIYSNVVANPTDEATDTLSKIKIGEIIYEISGANISSGNLKMERLYYTTGRTTSGTITLPKSIYNYDFLIIGGKNNDNYINYKPVVIDSDYSINQNQSLGFYNPGYVNFIFTSETELTITGQNFFGIFAIYGISNENNKDIISRTTELPEATETSPDFIEVSGELYYKSYSQPATTSSSSITDLTNTTWVFNGNPVSIPAMFGTQSFSINWNWTYGNNVKTGNHIYFNQSMTVMTFGASSFWDIENNQYGSSGSNTITITGGADVQNSTLISWLQNNATLQSQSSTYSYVKLSSNN